jgi:hypothetical protein
MSDDKSVKEILGEQGYEQIRDLLTKTFPGPQANVTDEFVDGFVRTLWLDYKPGYEKLGIPPPEPETHEATRRLSTEALSKKLSATPEGQQLYWAEATHHRTLKVGTSAPMQSEFTGYLPQVRLTLPGAIVEGFTDPVATSIGEVYLSGDHELASLDDVGEKFADALGYTPGRVDLITPARLWGTRFSAFAIYLGYRSATDTAPSFYILEGGTATGQMKMVYFGQTIDTNIVTPGYYEPTPFSHVDNMYSGTLRMTPDGLHPQTIVITSTEPTRGAPYITVTLSYVPASSIDSAWPALITLQAASRVALVAEAMGVSDAVPLQVALAELAKTYDWIIEPTMGGEALGAEALMAARPVEAPQV